MPQAPVPEEMNVYQNAEARFEVAAQKLGLEQGLYRYLKYPKKEITLYIPVGMDNGQLEVFVGYRVLHSTVRGPGKGGIRFAPDVSIDEVRALIGEPPLQSEIAFQARLGALGDDRHEQSAVLDLLSNLLIPGIPSPQLALIEPNLDAGGAQSVADAARRVRFLTGVTQENRPRLA